MVVNLNEMISMKGLAHSSQESFNMVGFYYSAQVAGKLQSRTVLLYKAGLRQTKSQVTVWDRDTAMTSWLQHAPVFKGPCAVRFCESVWTQPVGSASASSSLEMQNLRSRPDLSQPLHFDKIPR